MATPFATADDVAARWRPLSSAEQTVATTLCGDASALIRAQFPGIDASVTAGNLDPDVLVMIVANMVRRAMVAPNVGVSQESQTAGPFSHSQSFSNPLGNVFLMDSERVLILGYQPRAMSVGYANTTTQFPPLDQYLYNQ